MSITQKNCPAEILVHDPETGEDVFAVCGKRAATIARDRFGLRTCPDGHAWYPRKMTPTEVQDIAASRQEGEA
jgi:hypothetical protein